MMPQRIVIKIGGATLFSEHGFQSSLRALLAEHAEDQVFVMAGGGDLIEAMRTAHRLYPQLSTEEMHWSCVELLDVCWNMVKEIFPLQHAIYERMDLIRLSRGKDIPYTSWVRVQAFYSRCGCEEIPASWLPSADWNTTTDALAWLLAMTIQADRVILLKQCPCDATWSLDQATELGVIDSELARLCRMHAEAGPSIELRSLSIGR
jgi:hypothetical protein